MADIFLSYAREDLEHARRLAKQLRGHGWSVWWDRTLRPGDNWSDMIERELDATRCVIVLWSQHSRNSQYVREEAQEGIDRGLYLPAVVESGMKPPFGFRGVHWANLADWSGVEEHEEFRALTESIERLTPRQRGPVVPSGKERVAPQTSDSTPKARPVRRQSSKTATPRPTEPHSQADRARSVSVATTKLVTVRGGVELVQIPAGSFEMGSPQYENNRHTDEGPQHKVTLRAFRIGRYAVTNEEYKRFCRAYPQYKGKADFREPKHPVTGINWEEARRFAEYVGGRLPTEAEWEYAARAGTTAPYLTGPTTDDLNRFAWYGKNSGGVVHNVGQKEANAWGLYDVLGNVWEWTEDDWHDSYDDAPDDGSAWVNQPRADRRVVRGGSCDCDEYVLRAAGRNGYFVPNFRSFDIGFRVVVSPFASDSGL